MASNIASVLDAPASEIKQPPALPVGSYIGRVQGLPRYDKSANKGTPFIEFTVILVSALEDVDEDDLKAVLNPPDGPSKQLKDFQYRRTFYYKEEDKSSLWRFKKFIEHCGFDPDEGTPRQQAESVINSEVGIHLKHTPSQDGESVYAEIDKTFQPE